MEGLRRDITLGFKIGLRKIMRYLDEKDTTKYGNVSGKEQPSSSSTNTKHHETIPPKGEILQEETDHDHSPNIEQPFFSRRPPIGGHQMKPKLEFPNFDGETKQSMVWINRAEEIFSIHNVISDEEMIKYASMQLEGRAYNWYMWWKVTTHETMLHWNTFKHKFFKRFEELNEKYFFARIIILQ